VENCSCETAGPIDPIITVGLKDYPRTKLLTDETDDPWFKDPLLELLEED
jgi:hypothetical protein